jgi:hypothetical protein
MARAPMAPFNLHHQAAMLRRVGFGNPHLSRKASISHKSSFQGLNLFCERGKTKVSE